MNIVPVESFEASYSPKGKGLVRFKLAGEDRLRTASALDPCMVSAIIAILSAQNPYYDLDSETFIRGISETHGVIARGFSVTESITKMIDSSPKSRTRKSTSKKTDL